MNSLPVNNAIYEELGHRWYTAQDDPVALLRAESRLRNPWVAQLLKKSFPETSQVEILDMGCGGGFLSNDLGARGYRVTGVDASADSLKVAALHDASTSVRYVVGDANHLPFADASFDAVCAMDFLEHVQSPAQIIAEASRVLRPGGLFFFHTFNRNWISWLLIIKFVEWFVKNTPKKLHVLKLFVKPQEVRDYCHASGLEVQMIQGVVPCIFKRSTLGLALTGVVPADFSFKFTSVTVAGYTGFARKLR